VHCLLHIRWYILSYAEVDEHCVSVRDETLVNNFEILGWRKLCFGTFDSVFSVFAKREALARFMFLIKMRYINPLLLTGSAFYSWNCVFVIQPTNRIGISKHRKNKTVSHNKSHCFNTANQFFSRNSEHQSQLSHPVVLCPVLCCLVNAFDSFVNDGQSYYDQLTILTRFLCLLAKQHTLFKWKNVIVMFPLAR